jgi:hypothetical protein
MRKALVALALAVAALMVTPGSAHADGIGHDAVIKNQKFSYATITVCHNAASDTSCVPGSYGFLSPGQNTNSKFGWSDADGIWCGRGWWCKIDSNTFRGSGTGWGSRFIKIGVCFGCTMYVYVFPDRG